MKRFKEIMRWILCAVGAYFIVTSIIGGLMLDVLNKTQPHQTKDRLAYER